MAQNRRAGESSPPRHPDQSLPTHTGTCDPETSVLPPGRAGRGSQAPWGARSAGARDGTPPPPWTPCKGAGRDCPRERHQGFDTGTLNLPPPVTGFQAQPISELSLAVPQTETPCPEFAACRSQGLGCPLGCATAGPRCGETRGTTGEPRSWGSSLKWPAQLQPRRRRGKGARGPSDTPAPL